MRTLLSFLALMFAGGLLVNHNAPADQPSGGTVEAPQATPEKALQGGSVTVLFDGSTSDGWRGREDLWSIEDGQIVGRTTDENPIDANTFFIHESPVSGQFEITFQYKMEGGNSGLQYLSRVIDEEKFIVSGYQADIDSTGKFTGILYEEKARGILATRGQKVTISPQGKKSVETFGEPDSLANGIHDGEWNDYRVLVRPLEGGGNHTQHFINESLMSEVIDHQVGKAAKEGIVALQIHRGPAMTVRFKNISVRRW